VTFGSSLISQSILIFFISSSMAEDEHGTVLEQAGDVTTEEVAVAACASEHISSEPVESDVGCAGDTEAVAGTEVDTMPSGQESTAGQVEVEVADDPTSIGQAAEAALAPAVIATREDSVASEGPQCSSTVTDIAAAISGATGAFSAPDDDRGIDDEGVAVVHDGGTTDNEGLAGEPSPSTLEEPKPQEASPCCTVAPEASNGETAVAGNVAAVAADTAGVGKGVVEVEETSALASEVLDADSSDRQTMLGFTPAPRSPAAVGSRPGLVGADHVGHRRIWKVRHDKRPEENDEDPNGDWYRHKRHVIVFSFSGKPIFSRYGAEDGLSATTGTLSAIVAKFQQFFFSASGNSDCLRYMVAGDHLFAFVERGPLWLVCISKCGDAYLDMVNMLHRIHLQIITLLTAGVERTLQNRPSYDMRKIMDGTDAVVNSLIRWCTQDMYLQVEGLEALPLPPASRGVATDALRSARIPNVLCAWMMAEHRIISLVCNKQFKASALDLSFIVNIIMSSTSLRTGESWTPVCLPHLNDKAFAYAYISFIEDTDVAVVFLSTSSEGEQFYEISQKVAKVKQTVRTNGCLDAVAHAIGRCPIDFRPSSGGAADQGDDSSGSPRRSLKKSLLAPSTPDQWRLLEGVIHAAYFVPSLQQYFSSAVAPEYRTRRRTKTLFRNYGRCRGLLRNAKLPSHICIATDHECFYVSMAADFQVYLTVPRGISTKVIGEFMQWVKAQDSHIFLGAFSSW